MHEQVESSMAYSQVPSVRMETPSQSNMIEIYFGEDDISNAIPVLEREQEQTYEMQMGSPEMKILLKDKWKEDPPMSDEQQTKLVLMVTKKSYSIGANIINHGPYTHQRIAGNNTQKGTNLRRVMVSQELHTYNQLEE